MKYRILFQAKKQKVHNVYLVENQPNKRKEKQLQRDNPYFPGTRTN